MCRAKGVEVVPVGAAGVVGDAQGVEAEAAVDVDELTHGEEAVAPGRVHVQLTEERSGPCPLLCPKLRRPTRDPVATRYPTSEKAVKRQRRLLCPVHVVFAAKRWPALPDPAAPSRNQQFARLAMMCGCPSAVSC
jgi:hypothetical protein